MDPDQHGPSRFVRVDDHGRLAYSEIHPDERAAAGPELRARPKPDTWSALEYTAHSREVLTLGSRRSRGGPLRACVTNCADVPTIRPMALSSDDEAYLQRQHSAGMVTIGADGLPKVARVAVVLVDGRLWSSATEDRVRTRRLRSDPRCVLYVHDATAGWLALETTVTILKGPEVPQQSVRMFRLMQAKPEGPLSWFGGELDEAAFEAQMVAERRIIYEFDVHRTYGMH
jgi:Pyridoxamine 5'-phosphate oxidase